jgi:hypothetical protein
MIAIDMLQPDLTDGSKVTPLLVKHAQDIHELLIGLL